MNRFLHSIFLTMLLITLLGVPLLPGFAQESTPMSEGISDSAGQGVPSSGEATDTALARDISESCLYNGRIGSRHPLADGTYAWDYQTQAKDGACALYITVPENEVAGAVYVQWHALPVPLDVQTQEKDESWTTVTSCDDCFYAQFIPVPELQSFRIVAREDPEMVLSLCEVRILTPGTPPDHIQIWQHPGDKVDMMLIVGHPDDEVLWFGGLLPYYAGELNKNVLVICASMNRSFRRLELLDCLWACGVRTHPVHSVLYDFTTNSKNEVFEEWGGKARCLKLFTSYYRMYRPDVVMLHDIRGEYGHGIHKAVSYLGRECAALAADPKAYPEQVEQYGTWDIPKIYIHLYEENKIVMDWNQPLSSFGGKTAMEVAMEAMQWHKTQVDHGWEVVAGGKLDNACFGLWRTLVGPDEAKNDLFEHIPPR